MSSRVNEVNGENLQDSPNQKSWLRQCHIVLSFARRVKSVINQRRSATCARLQTTFIIITSHAIGPIIIIAHFAAVKDPLIYRAATRTFSPCHPELSPVILTFEYFLRKVPRVQMKLHDSCQVSTLCLKNTRHHNFTQMLTDFQNSFTGRLTGKFATKSNFTIPPHPKHVSTLPCEKWMSENWRQSEICIVINDKSQGSVP